MSAALLFTACQSAQPVEKHSFRCYVRYIEDQAQLRAEATLLDADSAAVEPPGGLRFQGQVMSKPPVAGAGYRYQHNGVAGDKALFGWTNAAGRQHEFALPMLPVQDFGFGPPPVYHNRPDTLRWQGEPLTPGETLVLMWENKETNQTKPMEIYSSSVQKEIVFPAAKMAELTPGDWSLYLVRRKMVKGDAAGVPATGVVEYYTRSQTFVVK